MIRLQELELVLGHTNERTTQGWTDRRDVGNSILDVPYNKNGGYIEFVQGDVTSRGCRAIGDAG